MSAFLKLVGAVVLAAAFLLVLPIIGVVAGAFSGWVVGLIFPDTFHAFREALHIGPLACWQAGAMLGFVGGFFRTTVEQKKSGDA